MKKIRIGSGAGYAGDRLEPALKLMEDGNLDYIGFECLAERTIAIAQKQKQNDPSKGYNDLLEYRMEKVLPLAHEKGVKVLTNMGAANPVGGMEAIKTIAERQGLKGMKIAAGLGDDIFENIEDYYDYPVLETGDKLGTLSDRILSANAYLGIKPLLEALEAGADVIITGRTTDPSLFMAPLFHEFGWSVDDYDKLGKGTLVRHLLECAGQITGGYFADPGKHDIPDLWNLGFPFADVDEEGNGIISKVDGTGGIVNTATCTEQMLYEIYDPSEYITPDCVADFSNVEFESVGKDKVSFKNATGREPTDTYKVNVGYTNGFFGEGEISYGGSNCVERATLAIDIVKKRMKVLDLDLEDIRYDLIGINSITPGTDLESGSAKEVRLRVAGRTHKRDHAKKIGNEVETLYTNGPAGGGGAAKRVIDIISVASILIPKTDIETEVIIKEI